MAQGREPLRRPSDSPRFKAICAGVTTIYDAGNNQDFIFSFREGERSGEIVAPRIFGMGMSRRMLNLG